ncbi:MAG: chromosome partitioning protein ParB [Lysobacterales bacterium CG17_big_fil_post_rev_8_21_14_2_50_64_11]|nr:MAG: chromosome partitioning protein ParB [Xanthomonadales bacterium CG17_big_fil_post_rev_8_21_14_2_50_64_11]PIX59806.1 MAG: chromosome partitioning protein ParB [Xanthomonadales bacterium CG_4_10_14_3_um_filter_64_11]
MAIKKRGLGRGLDALLGSGNQGAREEPDSDSDSLRTVPVEFLKPGRYQPRTGMDPERLAELADSIRAQGLIQPIVVRSQGKDRYEIIAGERRWRAAQLAGLSDVPVVLREVDDRSVIAMALIENIQREDLNPLEEAQALHRLIDEFSLTHQQAADAVGRSRAAVSNLLRLLDLPPEVRRLLEQHAIEMGHARALLALPAAAAGALAREAAERGMSVREIERRVHAISHSKPASTPAASKKADPDVAHLERELSEILNARVAVQQGRGGRGKLVVHYHGLDSLEGILEKLRGRAP